MFRACYKLAIGFAAVVCLIGAPCRECQPKEQAKHCGHDCCPKPKPAQPQCKWQPAGYDVTLETKTDMTPATPVVVHAAAEVHAAPGQIEVHIPGVEPSHAHAPPIYLSSHNLLI